MKSAADGLEAAMIAKVHGERVCDFDAPQVQANSKRIARMKLMRRLLDLYRHLALTIMTVPPEPRLPERCELKRRVNFDSRKRD